MPVPSFGFGYFAAFPNSALPAGAEGTRHSDLMQEWLNTRRENPRKPKAEDHIWDIFTTIGAKTALILVCSLIMTGQFRKMRSWAEFWITIYIAGFWLGGCGPDSGRIAPPCPICVDSERMRGN